MIKKFTEQDMQNYADYVAKAVLSNIQPDLAHWYAEWHKPAKKVIDLSVLIESGIDCEFNDGSFDIFSPISKLTKIKDCKYPYASVSEASRFCQPRMNHKHAWQGGECPLPEGFRVKVWFRDGSESTRSIASGNGLYWGQNNHGSDIIAFEVLGVADGYVMPWEQDNE
tara:strand:- start:164 stop:667 length:504 start_codon:yes stop_codon:yes gene_type:complete